MLEVNIGPLPAVIGAAGFVVAFALSQVSAITVYTLPLFTLLALITALRCP
jgi:hypothetical protein